MARAACCSSTSAVGESEAAHSAQIFCSTASLGDARAVEMGKQDVELLGPHLGGLQGLFGGRRTSAVRRQRRGLLDGSGRSSGRKPGHPRREPEG